MSPSNKRLFRRVILLLVILPILLFTLRALAHEAPSFPFLPAGSTELIYLPIIKKPRTEPVTLVRTGSTWKYLDNGTNQGTTWREPAFDDSSWSQGPAQLGYGDGDEATVLDYGLDPSDKYITTYFRHTFTVDQPGDFTKLNFYLLRDDGAVIYLNGQEVVRSNLPTGKINYKTVTVLTMNLVIENMFHLYQSDASALVSGTNVLAVEVHQGGGSSSDMSFDLIMEGITKKYEATTHFAAIGDYGEDSNPEAAVANMVADWDPDFVITLGNNNYPAGEQATIDANIDKHYGNFIGRTFANTRFFPSLGDRDWGDGSITSLTCASSVCTGPYFNHFNLPGNERYYDYVKGPIHFFVLDSNSQEPDGITTDSIQAAWLQAALASATEPWKVVYFHHPPYSSGSNGSTPALQWPFEEWGADLVLSGHDHNYERLVVDGFPYFVNGAGGRNIRDCGTAIPGSQICYDTDFGAMTITVDACRMTLTFVTPGIRVPTNNPYIDTVLLENGLCP
jgi:hypothetical protein